MRSWTGSATERHCIKLLPRCRFHGLFAVQVAAMPSAVAVVYRDRAGTYAELDGASNRLAHRLIGLGAGPGRLVGLLLPRGD